MGQNIIETRLIPFPIQKGDGIPTHISPSGSIYFDKIGRLCYQNVDGINDWVLFSTSQSSNVTSVVVSSADTLTILGINTYYGVDYNGNVDLTLPTPSGFDGYMLTIKDESGECSKNRIRLIPSTGTIDNYNYVDMKINYMSLTLIARNNNWWII
jgi:hypothetical protein